MDPSDRQFGGNGHREALHFSHPPKRVVSLVPSLTESMFDLGFGDSLVGITDYCTYPKGSVEVSTAYRWSKEPTHPGNPGFETGPGAGRLGRKHPRLGRGAGCGWSGGLGHLSQHSARINGDPLDIVQAIQEPDGARSSSRHSISHWTGRSPLWQSASQCAISAQSGMIRTAQPGTGG